MILSTDRLWIHSKNLAGKFNCIFNEQQYQTLKAIRSNLQVQVNLKYIYLFLILIISFKQLREYVNEYGKEVFKNLDENKVLTSKKLLAPK